MSSVALNALFHNAQVLVSSTHILSPYRGHQYPGRASPLLRTTHHRCGSLINCFLCSPMRVDCAVACLSPSRCPGSHNSPSLSLGRRGWQFLLFPVTLQPPRETIPAPNVRKRSELAPAKEHLLAQQCWRSVESQGSCD